MDPVDVVHIYTGYVLYGRSLKVREGNGLLT